MIQLFEDIGLTVTDEVTCTDDMTLLECRDGIHIHKAAVEHGNHYASALEAHLMQLITMEHHRLILCIAVVVLGLFLTFHRT